MFYGMALSLHCILSIALYFFVFFFTEADLHCYKLEWQQAPSGTFMVSNNI